MTRITNKTSKAQQAWRTKTIVINMNRYYWEDGRTNLTNLELMGGMHEQNSYAQDNIGALSAQLKKIKHTKY